MWFLLKKMFSLSISKIRGHLWTIKHDLSFDENISNFHFYDIDFCLSAHKKKITMGTVPIWVTHNSIGDWTKSEDWKTGAEKFIKKWNKLL